MEYNWLCDLQESGEYNQIKNVFRQLTGLSVWVDSLEQKEVTQCPLSSTCFKILSQTKAISECQKCLESSKLDSHRNGVTINLCPSGYLHLCVDLKLQNRTVGYLNCGGDRRSRQSSERFSEFERYLNSLGVNQASLLNLKSEFEDKSAISYEDLTRDLDFLYECSNRLSRSISNLIQKTRRES